MLMQVLDKEHNVIRQTEVAPKATAHITHSRVKYYKLNAPKPKTEVIPASTIFHP